MNRREITDAATLTRRLKSFRREFRRMSGASDIRAIGDVFLQLRARLQCLESASWGFFSEQDSMISEAQRDLIAAKECAELALAARRDREYRELIEQERTERAARSVVRGFMSDRDYAERAALRRSLGLE